MMNIRNTAFLSILALTTLVTPALSQQKSDFDQISAGNISTTDFKTWSDLSVPSYNKFQTVSLQDGFGKYVTAFDKNGEYQRGNATDGGIVSYWYFDKIRIYAYSIINHKIVFTETKEITIQVHNKIHQLKGVKNYYKITPSLAYSLKTAPTEATKIKIKIELVNGGMPIQGEIGANTLTKLRTIYQQAKAPSEITDFPQVGNSGN
jgi:hypothetical protein